MNWTQQNLDLATRLWNEGYSATLIAIEMGDGCTRNAIIGKLSRMGLNASSRDKFCERKVKQPPKRLPVARNPFMPSKPPRIPVMAAPIAPPVFSTPDPLSTADAVVSLRNGDCRFPHGDPGQEGFRFCCEPAVIGVSYCAYHSSIAYGRGTPSERKAVSLALMMARK